jgi:hypothetical protein
MKSSRIYSFFALFIIASSLSAAPKIQFDTKTFQCGTIVEGKPGVVKSVFNIKNIGDEVLRLENVRPNCGCVVVKYDSVIKPGTTAQIESFMNTKGFHSGPVAKWILVASNAKNEPLVKLKIAAVFLASLDVSKKFLTFNAAFSNKDTIFLASNKSDLEILGVEFRTTATADTTSDWHTDIPLPIGFALLPIDSTRADGFKVWGYELHPPKITRPLGGEITIRTNHPERAQIIIPASLLR